MIRIIAVGLVLVAGACTRAAVPADSAAQGAGTRAAALDPAQARRLCANPDSVLAGRAACVLLDQSAPPPARPAPRP